MPIYAFHGAILGPGMSAFSAIVSMGKFCAAFNCTNSEKSRGLSFYRFPKCLKRRRQWEAALSRTDPVSGRLWRATEHSRLCSVHFISGHFCNSTLKVYKSCDIHTSSRCLCAFHFLEAYFMVMCLVLSYCRSLLSYPQYGGTQNGLPKIRTGVQVLNNEKT